MDPDEDTFRVNKNEDILEVLDGFKNYAKEYEERKRKQEEEEERAREEAEKKKMLQSEIKEQLRKIQELEEQNKLKYEEEKKLKEEKRKKVMEMKAKIQEELEKVKKLEEIQFSKIQEEQEERKKQEDLRKKREMEQKKKMQEEEEKQRVERKKAEEAERKRLLEEIAAMKKAKLLEEEKRLERETKKAAAAKQQAEMEHKKRLQLEEEKRQKAVAEEKKRLIQQEMERERLKAEEEKRARMEEDQRIAAGILARKQAEQEEEERRKKEAEAEKVAQIEWAKKQVVEDKRKAILQKFESATQNMSKEIERPKKKSVANPLAQKFEELAKISEAEEKARKERQARKKAIKKSQDIIKKSYQKLTKLSIDKLNKSQSRLLTKSKESMKRLKTSHQKLKASLSRSKLAIDKNSNASLTKKRTDASTEVCEEDQSKNVSQKEMQNYLLSQVLFDGEEEVSSTPLNDLQEEAPTDPDSYEDRLLMSKERQFEEYKKEMEAYLSFVCDEKSKVKKKRKTTGNKTDTKKEKLLLNIRNIKEQFETNPEGVEAPSTPAIKSAPVKKLDPTKIFQNTEEGLLNVHKVKKKSKEYVPVIIDKDAFERTMGKFENIKREEERKQEEERIIRERALKLEQQRIEETKQKEREEYEQRQRELQALKDECIKEELDQENYDISSECEEEEAFEEVLEEEEPIDPEVQRKMDIHEQIKQELERIKIEEEKMKEKIDKERKKKDLIRQIKEQIEKINTVDGEDSSQQGNHVSLSCPWKEDFDSSTSSSLEETRLSTVAYSNVYSHEQSSVNECNDEATPQWIKIFQERSERLRKMEENSIKSQTSKSTVCTKTVEPNKTAKVKRDAQDNVSFDDPKVENSHNEKAQTFFTHVDMPKPQKNEESQFLKKVSSVKAKFERKDSIEEKATNEVVKRKTSTKIKDRVRKVKSLLLDGESKVKETKAQDDVIALSAKKASMMKSVFETNLKKEEDKIHFIKKEQQEWKWKTKGVLELYQFINQNKSFVPETISNQAKCSLEQTEQENKNDIGNNKFGSTDKDIVEYTDFINSVHAYVDSQSSSESENGFKDTIQGYLELIEDKPKREKPSSKAKSEKKFSGSIKAAKEMLLGGSSQETKQSKGSKVGKVDTSFLFKEQNKKEVRDVSKDNCKSLTSKYEVLSTEPEKNPLYTMQKKIINVPEDIDSMAWKKKCAQQQWKYKQKAISDLQNFVNTKKDVIDKKSTENKAQSYTPMFPKIDFNKKESEEKKMEDFKSFMDEIHNYLESDTSNEEESDIKWSVQAYLDLIEDNTQGSKFAHIPIPETWTQNELVKNTSEIKEQLLSTQTQLVQQVDQLDIGKVDASFLTKSNGQPDTNKSIARGGKLSCSTLRSQYEGADSVEEIKEPCKVKRKLINFPEQPVNEPQEARKNVEYQWKYKQKEIAELQKFLNKNKNVVPAASSQSKYKALNESGNSELHFILQKNEELQNRASEKETEFENFMSDLHAYMDSAPANNEHAVFMNGLQEYMDLIEQDRPSTGSVKLPNLCEPKSVKNLKDQLTTQHEESRSKKNLSVIGKVSHILKKPSKDNSKLIKENLTLLLQPGKAKAVKNEIEKPKLTRSSSESRLSAPSRRIIQPIFESKGVDKTEVRKPMFTKPWQPKIPTQPPTVALTTPPSSMRYEQTAKQPTKVKSEWEGITDPLERKKAILAKHGFKLAVLKDDSDSDIEDLCNLDDTEEDLKYKESLKQQYGLYDDSDRESSPEVEKKSSSISSLLNILSAMKKSNMNRKFSDSKSRLLSNSTTAQSIKRSTSAAELSELSTSCSDLRSEFENNLFSKVGQNKSTSQEQLMSIQTTTASLKFQLQSQEKTFDKSIDHHEVIKRNNTAKTRSFLENCTTSCHASALNSTANQVIGKDSVSQVQKLYESGQFSKEDIQNYINSRSETSSSRPDLAQLKKKYNCREGNESINDEDLQGLSVQEELELLRSSSKIKNMFRLEKGENNTNLRRANSCIGVSGEQTGNLDEEVLRDVSVSNKMVKAMFEASAPKYKFGGSKEGLESTSQENVSKRGPVMKPSVKPKEERKWVLDTINKYFEVIVEEDEDEDEDNYEDSEDDDTESELSYSEELESEDEELDEDPVAECIQEENDFKSTSKIRGLFSSVISGMSGSVGNLNKSELIQNMKQNLGSQINLRMSKQDLSTCDK